MLLFYVMCPSLPLTPLLEAAYSYSFQLWAMADITNIQLIRLPHKHNRMYVQIT